MKREKRKPATVATARASKVDEAADTERVARRLRLGALVEELLELVGRPAHDDADALLPLAEAARVACTSMRVVREAVAAGELAAFGRRRDRAVRRGDLAAWIESRRVRPVAGPDDTDIEKRMRRLQRETGATR